MRADLQLDVCATPAVLQQVDDEIFESQLKTLLQDGDIHLVYGQVHLQQQLASSVHTLKPTHSTPQRLFGPLGSLNVGKNHNLDPIPILLTALHSSILQKSWMNEFSLIHIILSPF